MDWLKLAYEAIGAEHPRLSLFVAVLLGAAVSGGSWWLIGQQYWKDRARPASTASTAPSELPQPLGHLDSTSLSSVFVLPPPKDSIIQIEWVMKRNYAIEIRGVAANAQPVQDYRPAFRLKNVGPLSVTDVEIRWSGIPQLQQSVLNSEIFKPLRPRFEASSDGRTAPLLWFSDPMNHDRSYALPVADEDLVDMIPFLKAAPTSDETAPVLMPGEVLNALTLEMILKLPRPKSWEIFVEGPSLPVQLSYKVGRDRHERKFRIVTRVMYFNPMAGGVGMKVPVYAHEQSPGDFRANVSFEVEQAN